MNEYSPGERLDSSLWPMESWGMSAPALLLEIEMVTLFDSAGLSVD
jgi:hypothetical protein